MDFIDKVLFHMYPKPMTNIARWYSQDLESGDLFWAYDFGQVIRPPQASVSLVESW